MNLYCLASSQRSKRKRVGRGPGSKMGKTSGRGHKGDKSRSGYTRPAGKAGGQLPLYRKLPIRGFSNARFSSKLFVIDLDRIEQTFEDGERVTAQTLLDKGFPLRRKRGLKILGSGHITKKLTIVADFYTAGAKRKLEEAGVEFTLSGR